MASPSSEMGKLLANSSVWILRNPQTIMRRSFNNNKIATFSFRIKSHQNVAILLHVFVYQFVLFSIALNHPALMTIHLYLDNGFSSKRSENIIFTRSIDEHVSVYHIDIIYIIIFHWNKQWKMFSCPALSSKRCRFEKFICIWSYVRRTHLVGEKTRWIRRAISING